LQDSIAASQVFERLISLIQDESFPLVPLLRTIIFALSFHGTACSLSSGASPSTTPHDVLEESWHLLEAALFDRVLAIIEKGEDHCDYVVLKKLADISELLSSDDDSVDRTNQKVGLFFASYIVTPFHLHAWSIAKLNKTFLASYAIMYSNWPRDHWTNIFL
jgi:hypothetical protein